LLDLQHLAASEAVPHFRINEKNRKSIGLIKPGLPRIALDVKKIAAYIRNELAALKKAEPGHPDQYHNKVKLWYMFLGCRRESGCT
jgi:hypothetical protein